MSLFDAVDVNRPVAPVRSGLAQAPRRRVLADSFGEIGIAPRRIGDQEGNVVPLQLLVDGRPQSLRRNRPPALRDKRIKREPTPIAVFSEIFQLRVAPRIVPSGVSTSFRYTLWVVASRLRNRNVRLRESCEWPPSRPTREFIAVAAFGRQLRESDALRSPTPRQSSNLGIRFLVDAFARPQHLVAT